MCRYRVGDKRNIGNQFFDILSYFFWLLSIDLIVWVKLSILFVTWYVVTLRYISTSPKRKLENNIDVSDYFAGDNETYE